MPIDRHIGITGWALRQTYPWLTMPAVTDAWVADAKYLDSTGSVGTWGPQKGIIPLVQATGGLKPTYSAAFGSKNLGMLTFDGVDDWMSGDALAAKVAGNPLRACTLIISLKLSAVVDIEHPWSFSAASDTATLFTLRDAITSHLWQTNYRDDLGGALRSHADTGTIAAAAGTTILTVQLTQNPLNRSSIRVNGVDAAATHAGIGPEMAQTTLTKFTLGAFRGASTLGFCSMNLREMVFAPSILTLPQITACENFMMTEAL